MNTTLTQIALRGVVDGLRRALRYESPEVKRSLLQCIEQELTDSGMTPDQISEVLADLQNL